MLSADADADGQFEGSPEAATLWLEAELAIVSTGEAIGTPVRVDVAGSESFSFSFQGRVGQVLSISLSHHSQAVGAAAAMTAGAGHTLASPAWLEGAISVTAVTEPESSAVFLAGLTAIGLFGHRRLQR